MDFILARAHINMVGRNFREFFHDTLCTDAHKIGRDCRRNKHFRHLRKLFDKFLRSLIYGLRAVKFRIGEKLVYHVRAFAKLPPARHFIQGQGRIKVIFLVGELDRIRGALHQQIVNVKRGGKPIFSIHNLPLYKNIADCV